MPGRLERHRHRHPGDVGHRADDGELHGIAATIATEVEQQGAATGEIARNLAATANAVRSASQGIADTAGEARQTGEHANEVRASSGNLNDAVHALKHTVVRVVRTATEEVNRRVTARSDTDLPCTVVFDRGEAGAGRLRDLSIGGAMILGLTGTVGSRGQASFSGLTLAFVVRGFEDPDKLNIAFEADADQRKPLAALLEPNAPSSGQAA